MRVRAMAWQACSRFFDDHPEISERVHKQYMEATVLGLEDPVLRVQTKNLSSFLFFGEALDPVNMEMYAKSFLITLVNKVRMCKHRGVVEEAITSIAVVAGSIEKEFAPYYDEIMPILKNIITTSLDEKETRLRGKAFECMSLFGVAVGKEKFRQDCTECLKSLLSSFVGADCTTGTSSQKKNAETLQDYLKDAIERVSSVMETEISPFLGDLLTVYLKQLDVENLAAKNSDPAAVAAAAAAKAAEGMGEEDSDDEEEEVTLKNGKKVKSQQFREMAAAAETLCVLVTNAKETFIPHIPTLTPVLVKLFQTEDASLRSSLESNSVLEKCSDVWGAIVAILAKADANECRNFLMEYASLNIKWLQKEEDDAELVQSHAKGLAEVLQAACPSSSQSAEIRKQYDDF